MFRQVALFSSIVFVFACIVYVFIGSGLFTVGEIDISAPGLIDENSLSQYKGKNLFLLRAGDFKDAVEAIPDVKSAVVKKELPHRLVVLVSKYVPCAFFRNDKELAVSKEGVVFPYRETERVSAPFIVYDNTRPEAGEKYPDLEKAIQAYFSVKEVVPIDIIKVGTNADVFLYSKGAMTEIRMGSGDYVKKADYLKRLMAVLPSRNVKYIDLRFGNDIIVRP